MAIDPKRERDNDPLSPEDVDSRPASPQADGVDDVPVPAVMSPAEIDERAQVIERLEGDEPTP